MCQILGPPQTPDELGRLGPYRVLAVLGAGGMGVVFRAEDTQLTRLVALKVMLPNIAGAEIGRQRFLREARAAAGIKHDHIVSVYQVGEDRGVPFMAMELLEGEPLEKRLKREGKLPVAEVLRFGREIALGLAAAHNGGLIHRDIKPANLWLEAETGRIKVLDFGLARVAKERAALTQLGAIVGTPEYMAPEQIQGKNLDERCDLFSLGCVLYRMSTGKMPFSGTDMISTLMAVATEQPPPPRKLDPSLPAPLSKLILRMLAKEPEDRYQTPAELLDALRPVSTTGPADRSALAELESGPATPRPILPPPATDAGAPTLLEVLGLSAEDRRAAAAQYQRARAALAGGGTDMRHAYGLLVSSCTLDPTNTVYRRAVRRIGKKLGRPRGAAAARAREQLTAAQVAGDHRKMLEYGEAVLVEAPDDMPTHLAMAEAAAALGLAQLQVWLLEQACKEAPNNPEPARLLARAHEKQKHLGKAIAVWQALRKARPNDTEAPRKLETLLRLLARAYERKNDRPGAIAVWRAVLKLRPQDSEASRQITALSGDDTGAGRKADA